MKKLILFSILVISSLTFSKNDEINLKFGISVKDAIKLDENKNIFENIEDIIKNKPSEEEIKNNAYDYFINKKSLPSIDANLNLQYLKKVVNFAGLNYKVGAELNLGANYNYIKNSIESNESFKFVDLNASVSLTPIHISYNAFNIAEIYSGAKVGVGVHQIIDVFNNKSNAENSFYHDIISEKNSLKKINVPVEIYLGTTIKNKYIIEAGFGDELEISLNSSSNSTEKKNNIKHNLYSKLSLGYSFR